MWVMFISLLLSITISNALYAMEKTLNIADDEMLFVGESSSITSITRQPSIQFINTLADMRELSKEILDGKKTQDSNASNLKMLYEIKTPKNVVIDPRVFFEYADEQGLITVSEPGLCRCTVC